MLWIKTCITKKMEGTWVKEGIWDMASYGLWRSEKEVELLLVATYRELHVVLVGVGH
jgi:hypothetical protein